MELITEKDLDKHHLLEIGRTAASHTNVQGNGNHFVLGARSGKLLFIIKMGM